MNFYTDLEKFADRYCVIDPQGNPYTYRKLVEESDNFASRLQCNKKVLAFILCSNNIESIVAYLGILRSQNAAILLPSDIDGKLLSNLIKVYRPDYLWGPKEKTREIENFEIEETCHIFKNYRLQHSTVENNIIINSKLALLISTSGTTGSPKMVRLSGNNLESNAASIVDSLKIEAEDRPVTSLPMHYSYGLSVINSHLKVGATILLTNDSVVTRSFWDFFNKYKATSFSGVPYTYQILKNIRFYKMSLPGLKTITQAGGRLAPELALEFVKYSHERGIDFYIMYGQTEATARISCLPPKYNLIKYKSVGFAINHGEIELIDSDSKPITKPGIDGELVYKGPNVMLGYAEHEKDLEKDDDLKGVLKTGDIAHFDDEGLIYITGRKKRFIKVFGDRINLDEIESYLQYKGYACLCGGKDNLLSIATTQTGMAREIKNIVVKKYKFHHSAVKVHEVQEFLKSPSGKTQYEQTFERLLN